MSERFVTGSVTAVRGFILKLFERLAVPFRSGTQRVVWWFYRASRRDIPPVLRGNSNIIPGGNMDQSEIEAKLDAVLGPIQARECSFHFVDGENPLAGVQDLLDVTHDFIAALWEDINADDRSFVEDLLTQLINRVAEMANRRQRLGIALDMMDPRFRQVASLLCQIDLGALSAISAAAEQLAKEPEADEEEATVAA
jgi:hypothetical protein